MKKKQWVKNKFVLKLKYTDNILLVLSSRSSSAFRVSFTTMIGVPVGNFSANVSLVFLFSRRIPKKCFEEKDKRKKQVQNFVL